MQFIFNGTLEELTEAIHTKATLLHRDIVIYQDEPNTIQIGFQRSGHSGGRFFVANIAEENGKTILTGQAKDIYTDPPQTAMSFS